MKCPFELCDGSGLLPFILPNGTISRHAKIFCECRQEHEFNPRLQPDDFDFPMSYAVYRSLCQEHGWPDPGADYPPELEPREAAPLFEPRPWQKDQWASVQQLRAMNLHLNNQVKELLAKRKTTRGKY